MKQAGVRALGQLRGQGVHAGQEGAQIVLGWVEAGCAAAISNSSSAFKISRSICVINKSAQARHPIRMPLEKHGKNRAADVKGRRTEIFTSLVGRRCCAAQEFRAEQQLCPAGKVKSAHRKNALNTDNSNRAASFLGIECGGTRTTALLAPGGGRECLRAEFGPANLRLLDDEALVRHFAAIDGLRREAPGPLAGIAIGMAGARTGSDRQRIRAAAGKVWPNVPCYATHDLETGLAAGETGGQPPPAARVLILSGTGSCCFGRRRDGGDDAGRRLGPPFGGQRQRLRNRAART